MIPPLLLFASLAQAPPSVDGAWIGTLEVPGAKLRLQLNLKMAEGKLTATLDSLDQGARGIPVNRVALESGKLTWTVDGIQASYEGTLNAEGDQFEGTFRQGQAFPLLLKRTAEPAPPPQRPQEPKPPFPYVSEEVTFPSKADGVTLAGTLTKPPGTGPFATAILISGSGPQDRDETLLGHKPFLVLADYLTRQGIAVLRYDDRGTAKSTGDFKAATSADFALDAEGALEFLRKRKDVVRAGFIGHSEGGLIAPIVAARRRDVGFVVMLAGPGLPGEPIVRSQGMTDAMIDKQREESAWFRSFLAYDPQPALQQMKCPVLALFGELDHQVYPSMNAPLVEAALAKSGNTQATVKVLPGLNHLFQTARTGRPVEYGNIEETMSPLALKTVADWIAGLGR